ncbi:MAG: serine hydrolase [Bryobacteraceae bacterium]
MLRRTFLAQFALAMRQDRLDHASQLLKDAASQGRVGAASAAVQHGSAVTRWAVGKAKPDTVFLLASITKPMTATAVMMLADAGQVRLEDPVKRYIPEFRAGARERVTVRHLLTHTSGLPDMLPENEALRKRHAPLADFVAGTCRTPLLFEPGTQVKYQSMGILLAAEIVERVSKQPLRAFLRERLFTPLGMQTASLGLGGRRVADLAQCEVTGDEGWNWNSAYWRDLGSPWGGAHASTDDILRLLGYFLDPAGSKQILKLDTTDDRESDGPERGMGLRLGGGRSAIRAQVLAAGVRPFRIDGHAGVGGPGDRRAVRVVDHASGGGIEQDGDPAGVGSGGRGGGAGGMKRWLWAAVLLPAGMAFAQNKTPHTIEQLMSSPFPSELTAAPAGGHIAWVRNAAGVRNIWVASPEDYTARALTSYTADDGQDITGLTWAAGAGAIVYVRGGAANRGGDFPNPTSDPAGAEQEIWSVQLAGGAPKKLGEGGGAAISPKDGRVAFLQKGQIWIAPLDGSAKAEQLAKTRGKAQKLRWSPDGARLAFVSDRGDHSFIGVYDPAAKTVRYLDPGLAKDGEPAWSPDGQQIAFLRIPASTDSTLFGPRRTGDPWSIRIADPSSGKGRLLFQADPARGSVFHGLEGEDQILWASTGHLVFPWERDGWTHLYSIAAGGEDTPSAKLLTFGDYEVEQAVLTGVDGRRGAEPPTPMTWTGGISIVWPRRVVR